MAKEDENKIASFYKEHTSLIRLLTPEQAGRLLFAVFDCVFEGKDTDFTQDPLLKGVYDTVIASALRQAKRYNTRKKISESMEGNQNAKKGQNEPEPITTQPQKLYDPYPGDGLY